MINKTLITVVTVSWYSSSFIENLIVNLTCKARNIKNILFYIIDNSNGNDAPLSALKDKYENIIIEELDVQGLTGSWAHAFGLNYATSRICSPYILIIDPDIYLFKNDWDDFFVDEIEFNGAVAIGAPYPFWKLGKYHDFPSPCFLFFKPAYFHDIKLDWTPFATDASQKVINFFGRQIVRIGILGTRRRLLQSFRLLKITQYLERTIGVCGPDTGWLIAEYARKKRYNVILFEEVTGQQKIHSDFQRKEAYIRFLAAQYELFQYKNEIVLTHKYSTNNFLWKTHYSKDTKFWIEAIERVESNVC